MAAPRCCIRAWGQDLQKVILNRKGTASSIAKDAKKNKIVCCYRILWLGHRMSENSATVQQCAKK
ncbi:hypothetical protein ACFLYO_04705, partial [Chloroflexota bacterium]